MKNFTRFTAIIFLSAIAFFGAALEPARAATFFVNTKDDTNDAACLDSLGNCSLRAAVEQSNNLAGEDFIYFNASLSGRTIVLNAALTDIDITSSVTITGLGANDLP